MKFFLLLSCLSVLTGAFVGPSSRRRQCSVVRQSPATEDDGDVAFVGDDLPRLEDIENNNDDESFQEPSSPGAMAGVQTGGGAQLIMAMARKLLTRDNRKSVNQPVSDSSREDDGEEDEVSIILLPSGEKVQVEGLVSSKATTPSDDGSSSSSTTPAPPPVLPRWHPHAGISDINPSFRTSSPIMNNEGYARAIWRNVRKRNKPSLWAYALRTYERMEQDAKKVSKSSGLMIKQTNIHHEGALLACAKLGLWEKAMSIYKLVDRERESGKSNSTTVTDGMIFSLIKACVRGSKRLAKEAKYQGADGTTPLDKQREPLDAVLRVLETLEERQHLPLTAVFINPLAAAYQSIGLLKESRDVIQKHLVARSTGPEAETPGASRLNINDFGAKDKASYALLVRSAVTTRDWAEAVAALEDMTESGLYPNQRHLNAWTEVSERKSKARTTHSWKKKRDEAWLESVR